MRSGTIGVMLAHSGFSAVKKLAGTKDLFDREFEVARSAIGGGLAAAANVAMGEGTEQTPIAVVSDIPFVTFQHRNPSKAELESVYISPEEDLYAPFIMSAPWQKGGLSTANDETSRKRNYPT
jgi:F420-0:gamma-glutamyl ligase